ncbi:MAG: restriction endonuclease subunit S [Pseudomonadota bacterium]
MSFPQYPEYKDSGVEWLGKVPAHWEVTKLSYITNRIGSGKTPSGGATAYVSSGVPFIRSQNVHDQGLRMDDIVYIDEDTDREMAWSRVRPLDVLINITGASIGRSCQVSAGFGRANVNQHVCVIRLDKPEEASGWVAWAMKSPATKEQVRVSQTGAAREGLNFEQLAGFYLCMPTVTERRTVSAFLNHETTRIDTLVDEQRRLIELLKEKRQAVISHAITKGLDPDVPMKDSGIEWLGEVPAHWEVLPLSRVLEAIEQGWSPNASNTPAGPNEWGVVKLSSIKKGKFKEGENKALLPGADPDHSLEIKSGDLLVTRANTPELVGDACIAKKRHHSRLILSDLVYRLTLRKSADTRIVCWFLISGFGRSQIESDARGSSMSMAKVSQSHIRSWLLPLPPVTEQREIADYVAKKTGGIDQLVQTCEEALKLLSERRSALISAAVTGKIDVRGWQPQAGAAASSEATQTETV